MKLVLLIFRNLSRRRLRTLLSVLTLFIAAFLLTVLIAVPFSLNRMLDDVSTGLRVIVTAPNAYMLPIWYRDAIQKMPGVVAATAERQWGGIYKDERQPVVAFGIDPDVQEVFPESYLTPEQVQQFLRERRSALVGNMLMAKNHWHIGDWVTLKNGDSKLALPFVIIANLPAKVTQNSFIFRREYFDQAVKQTYGVDITDAASFIAVRVAHVTEIPRVIEEIDGRFRNSEYETSTITESDSIANGVSAIADLSTSSRDHGAAGRGELDGDKRARTNLGSRGNPRTRLRADSRSDDALRRSRRDGPNRRSVGRRPRMGAIRPRRHDGRSSRRPRLHASNPRPRTRRNIRNRNGKPRKRNRPRAPSSENKPSVGLPQSRLVEC